MKRKFLFVTIIGMFFVIILYLNSIIVLFFDSNMQLHKINFEDYNVPTTAYTSINSYDYDESLKEIIFCSGWAFVETDQDNADKKVYLILRGEKNSYITGECALTNDSLYEMKNWKNISGNTNAFRIEFSTINLPADSYKIYVYVEENEYAKGIADTGEGFRKNGIYVSKNSLGSEYVDIDPENVDESFSNGWLGLYYEDDCVELSGWSMIEGVESEQLDFYVTYKGLNGNIRTISVPNQYKTGLLDRGCLYLGSGVTGRLEKGDLPDDEGIICLIAQYNGKKYRSSFYSYNWNT